MPGTSTVSEVFRQAVERDPARLFLDCSGRQFTYVEMDREVNRMARAFLSLGVMRGDRVVTQLDNGPVAVTAWLAAQRIGAVLCPLNTAYKGEFLRHEVADSGGHVALVETEYAPRFDAVWDGMPGLSTILTVTAAAGRSGRGNRRILALDDVLIDDGDVGEARTTSRDLACLFYTSGTTGPSKGCMVSHSYLCDVARRILELSHRGTDELNWTPLPLFHLYAASVVLSSVMIGGAVSLAPRFSLSGFWPEVERTGARIVNLLGTMSTLLAHAPDTPESVRCRGRIRAVLSAPMSPDIQELWRDRFGVEAAGINAYGMTEAAMMTSATVGLPAPPGSAGRPNESFEVRIVDDDGHDVPTGAVGEVLCRPRRPGVMFDGYWNRPEATASATRDLWFHTGDYGRFDADGFFFFEDRKKDYLRRRGENISSTAVESTFLQHPAIAEVAAHAVASELGEDDVKVTVVLAPGADVSEEEICRWSIDHLPYFAVPRYIEIRDELPKNMVGRVLKYQLREEGRTPRTWDRTEADLVLERR